MNRTFFSFLFVFLSTSYLTAAEFTVSPGDGSMQSLSVVQKEVQRFLQKNPDESVTVFLRGGNYFLDEPIVCYG